MSSQGFVVEAQLQHFSEPVVAHHFVDELTESILADLFEAVQHEVVQHRDTRCVLLVLFPRGTVTGDGGVKKRSITQYAKRGFADEGRFFDRRFALHDKGFRKCFDMFIFCHTRGIRKCFERIDTLLSRGPQVDELHRY
jgi:hypothetical protein